MNTVNFGAFSILFAPSFRVVHVKVLQRRLDPRIEGPRWDDEVVFKLRRYSRTDRDCREGEGCPFLVPGGDANEALVVLLHCLVQVHAHGQGKQQD